MNHNNIYHNENNFKVINKLIRYKLRFKDFYLKFLSSKNFAHKQFLIEKQRLSFELRPSVLTSPLKMNNKSNFLNDVRWNKKNSKTNYWIGVLLILLSFACTVRGTANKRAAEKRILDSIIGHGKYDSRIRPSGVNSTLEKDGPCNVTVNIFVRSIGKISDLDMEYSIQITFREQWNDSRLEFNSINNISYLTLTEPEKIWKPDLFFSNEKEGHFHNIIMPNVLLRIFPNGQVLYSIRISLVLSCPMNLKYYPLDKQSCSIKMASYGYTTEDVVFIWKPSEPVQVTKNLNLPTFSLYDFNTGYCTSKTNTGEYSCIFVDLIFKREFSFYLIQIYIPNSMLVIVSWVSFWLDPNAIPARVSLGVTTLLTMATQISGINASLPPVSYTKAIDVWTGVCLTFVFGALLEFALVNYASRKDAHRMIRKKNEFNSKSNMMYGTGNNGNRTMNSFSNNMNGNIINNNTIGPGVGPLSGYGMNNAMGPLGMSATSNQMGSFMDRINGSGKQMKHVLAPPKMDFSDQGFLFDRNERNNVLPVIMPMNQRNNRTNDLRSCEVHINPPSTNFLKRWFDSFPTRSKRIDVISRIFFPTMFCMFNVVYWTTYLLRDDLKELKK
uniref:Glutamate-gated chloride ion channel n=1 Tax=Polyphagotarsonemus latus TaxID=1204166 RepID=A0AAN0N7B7_9ACAR